MSEEAVASFSKLDSFAYPVGAVFVSDSTAQVSFGYSHADLSRVETSTAMINVNDPDPVLNLIHSDSEKIVSYSPDGSMRAVMRSVPASPAFPVNTPKASKDTVIFLEVFNGQKKVFSKILDEKNGNVQTKPTITSGLRWSPSGKKLAWIVANDVKLERKSRLGHVVKVHLEKDYGEDIDGVISTSLVVLNLEDKKISVLGAPEHHGASRFEFISDDVVLLQAIDLSNERLLGLRSYVNRPFHLFVAKIAEIPEFKLISDRYHVNPLCNVGDDGKGVIISFVVPNDFGGHGSPLYPFVAKINVESLEVSDTKVSEEAVTLFSVSRTPFITKTSILFTEEHHSLLRPSIFDSTTMKCTPVELEGFDALDSIIVDDIRHEKMLIRISNPITFPRLAVYHQKRITYLTSEYKLEGLTYQVHTDENGSQAVLLIAEGESKKFILMPHGGPHGMIPTYFNRTAAFFALNGYSVAQINFRGSTGYSMDFIKELPGKVGTVDVEDVVRAGRWIRSHFSVERMGVWGWSHGGFLAAHMAGQHSDEIDFSVAGAPVTNFVSSYYSCDIPDWPLVEAGLTTSVDGDVEITPEVLQRLWSVSPIRYAKDITVPVLFLHGKCDRRVCYQQSVDMYLAMKRHQKKAYLVIYDGNNHSFHQRSSWDDCLITSLAFMMNPDEFIEKDAEISTNEKKKKDVSVDNFNE